MNVTIPAGTPASPAAQQQPAWMKWAVGILGGLLLALFVPLMLAALWVGATPTPGTSRQPSGYTANAARVQKGMSVAQVTAICGEPEHTQKIEVGGPGNGYGGPELPYTRTDMLYYDGRRNQLVFENDRLTSINQW